MSADSRRSSSSSTSASQPSTPSTGPSTPTGKSPPSFEGSSFSRYNSSTKRKLNPVRRCQSMKNPNAGNINGTSSITSLTNGISPCNSNNSSFSSIGSTPSFRSRRVSSTPSSLENGRNHTETDFVKYYQYKINRPDTSLPFTIMISNDSQETKTQFNSNGNKHSTNAKTNDTNDIDGVNNSTNNEHSKCRVLVLGSTSCGKTSLIRSFEDYIEQTDDSIDRDYAYYRTKYQDENRSNNPTKRSNEIKPALYLHFIEATSLHSCYPQSPLNFYQPDAYIVVYGVNSRESFEGAKKIIDEIFKWDDVDTKPIILVANKTDLVRSRIVSKQEGRQLAMMNNCKYIETSCTISHNVDFLLTGIGAQINLKINSKRCQPNGRKPNIIKRFLNKAVLKKSKSCDNLHVL